jgi:hypothetical protein
MFPKQRAPTPTFTIFYPISEPNLLQLRQRNRAELNQITQLFVD